MKHNWILTFFFMIVSALLVASLFMASNRYNESMWRRQAQVDSLKTEIEIQTKVVDGLKEEVDVALQSRDSAIAEAKKIADKAKDVEDSMAGRIDSIYGLRIEELQAYYDVNYTRQDSIIAVALDSAQAVSVVIDLETGKMFKEKSRLQSLEIQKLYAVLSEDFGVILTQQEIIARQDSIIRAYAFLVELGDTEVDRLRAQIKKERNKFKIIGAGGGLLALTLLIIL